MPANLPRITIITPSYNQGQFIEATIQSVLTQNYPNLEYIVLDGGSTDATLSILKKYEDRLRWISEKDGGQSDALNKGLRMASGEVLAFLNSDDLYEPGALRTIGEFFVKHPNEVWATGKCRTIDHRGREYRRLITIYKNFWLYLRSYPVLLVLNYVSQPATFWRRGVVEKVGYFDEGLHYAMDYDYWLRIFQNFRLCFVNQYLASFRIHSTSKAGSSAAGQFDAELAISRRYARSKLPVALHRLHRALIVSVYSRMLAREHLEELVPSELG